MKMLRQVLMTTKNIVMLEIKRSATKICTDNGGVHVFLVKQKQGWLHSCVSSKPLSSLRCSSVVARKVSVTDDGKRVEISWSDDKTSRFHASWLRHNCTCEKCYSASMNQPLMEIDKLPLDIRLQNAVISDKAGLLITWKDNCHSCEFSSSFLKQYCYSEDSLQKKKDLLKTKLYKQPSPPRVSWRDIEQDDKYLYRWLKDINEHGLGLISGAPIRKGFLLEFLPERVAPVMDNTYGKINDVIAEENPINLAYTQNKLQFHMDLVYYESSPGLQILHCIKFDDSISGGETVFVDMFAISEEFRKSNPDEFKTLCTVPCTFSRIHTSREDPAHLVMRKPIISLNKEEEIIGVSWNPAVVGPLEVHERFVDEFYRAYQLYANAIANFHTKNEVRLKPGEIIGFNNRRMAHGRNAFSSSAGRRHFQNVDVIFVMGNKSNKGSFITVSDFMSRLYILSKQHGDMSSIRRVGNMDWL